MSSTTMTYGGIKSDSNPYLLLKYTDDERTIDTPTTTTTQRKKIEETKEYEYEYKFSKSNRHIKTISPNQSSKKKTRRTNGKISNSNDSNIDFSITITDVSDNETNYCYITTNIILVIFLFCVLNCVDVTLIIFSNNNECNTDSIPINTEIFSDIVCGINILLSVLLIISIAIKFNKITLILSCIFCNFWIISAIFGILILISIPNNCKTNYLGKILFLWISIKIGSCICFVVYCLCKITSKKQKKSKIKRSSDIIN